MIEPVSTLPLSKRAAALKPSPTLAMSARIRQLRAEGVDVVNFSAGEPDFPTPESIREAAIRAIHAGQTRYTATSGTPELKAAIVEKLQKENGLPGLKPEQIVVSCGAKHSVFNALQALLNPGDQVVLVAPYWATYAEQVVLAEGEPVVVRQATAEAIGAALTARTKAVLINTPCNPTGEVIEEAELRAIAELVTKHGLALISDEIYERLVYGHRHLSPASFGPEVAERTITINGCSKTYAMTGWRVGYSASSPALAKAMTNLQDQVTSNANSVAQAAAVAALQMPQDEVERMRAEFEARRDLLVTGLNGIPGLTCRVPKGAFYAFPDVTAFLGEACRDDVALADLLVDRAHMGTVPGSVFEGPGHLRLSYAASRETIEKGLERLRSLLPTLA